MRFKVGLSICIISVIFLTSDALAKNCDYWKAKVGVDGIKYNGLKINEKDNRTVMEGIECLLQLEGDKTPGSFSGATSWSGPANLPKSTVEICALYYISFLFYQKYSHANGVALVSLDAKQNAAINADEFVKKAFESYRRWFEKIKKIGLEEARKQKLDPLECSTVRWY